MIQYIQYASDNRGWGISCSYRLVKPVNSNSNLTQNPKYKYCLFLWNGSNLSYTVHFSQTYKIIILNKLFTGSHHPRLSFVMVRTSTGPDLIAVEHSEDEGEQEKTAASSQRSQDEERTAPHSIWVCDAVADTGCSGVSELWCGCGFLRGRSWSLHCSFSSCESGGRSKLHLVLDQAAAVVDPSVSSRVEAFYGQSVGGDLVLAEDIREPWYLVFDWGVYRTGWADVVHSFCIQNSEPCGEGTTWNTAGDIYRGSFRDLITCSQTVVNQ